MHRAPLASRYTVLLLPLLRSIPSRCTRIAALKTLSYRPHCRSMSSTASSAAGAATGAAAAAAAAAAPHSVGLTGEAGWAALNDLDRRLLNWMQQLKTQLAERPRQTGFRVFSILTYRPGPPLDAAVLSEARAEFGAPLSEVHPYDNHQYVEGTDRQLAYVTGTNTEPCFIGNSICSERTAILQMRMKRYASVEKLYLTADADSFITPGLLCREFLSEFLAPTTPVIMAVYRGAEGAAGQPFDVQVTNLRELYPHPSIYLHVAGSNVADFAKQFHDKAEKPKDVLQDKPEWIKLYDQVVSTTAKDGRPTLHPLKYAAGILFNDGSVACTAMTKLLEFGWSLDPVVKLVPLLEDKRAAGVHPVLVLQADQFGNLHSLTAPARSHLSEYGYAPALLFHNKEGKLVQAAVRDLAPDVPDAIEDVLPGTVKQSTASLHACS